MVIHGIAAKILTVIKDPALFISLTNALSSTNV